MIYYNVKIKVEETIEKKWLKWMCNKHIKDVLKTKLFTKCVIHKIQYEENKYIIQYECKNKQNLENYINNFSKKLQQEHTELFNNKFTASRFITKKIDQIE